ncbi:hypothetical protein J8M97_24200 [Gordonia polyisoprenivorans]|uniref:hypothetical protein n=1 Tax=Gordonia polyisoprenivorans TaxID=84595 RepID=UPI001B8D8396|nr:hypothetical protein [Gordonia polyisoprenivorans]QUD82733.1 hypothetical protein J8M97_24200 [Gordonia polyisoprenivorans]
MTDDDLRSAGSPRFPDPPYSVDLLTDLDAGVLEPDVAAHIRSRLADDSGAREVLAALEGLRVDLRDLPVPEQPVPEWVDARTQQTLARIAAEVGSGSDITPLARRRPLRSAPRAAALLSVAAAVLVAVIVGVVLVSHSARTGAPSTGAQADGTRTASSSLAPSVAATGAAAALSVLGRTDGAPFASTAALRRCTAANGVAAETPVLGSGPVMVNGVRQVVILLATGTAGRFLALVVGPECDSGNPATISRAIIGG